MPNRPGKRLRFGSFLLVGLGVVLCGTEALGHKLNVFARVEGKTIRGQVYFRLDSPAKGAKVEVFDPQGEKLGELRTNEQGEFTFEVSSRCDHRLVANAGEGHGAEYTVKAEELPEAPSDPPAALPDDARLQQLIETALSKQLGPLREQIRQYEDRRRLTDVLGGIGYILGITGLLFYFLGARKKGSRSNE